MTFILHTAGPVKVGATIIGGIRNLGSNLGSRVQGEPSSGEIYSRLMALYGQKPTIQFTAEDIEGALTACGPTGLSLASGVTPNFNYLTLFGSKILTGGGIDATNHLSLVAQTGLLYPTTLSVAHQGDATIGYHAMLYSSDGIADPFTLALGATLPTIANFKKWTLESVTMGGTAITQNMNVSIDFGVKAFGEGADSNIRDSIVAISAIEPKITVSSSCNGPILALLGVEGAFSLVLRDRLPGGSFGTSTITIAATTGLAMQDTPFQASGHRPGDVSLSGHIYWDGATAPLTYTYAKGSEGV